MIQFSALKIHDTSKSKNDVLDDVLDDVLENENVKSLLLVLKKNPKIKQKDLAKELNVSLVTVQRLINQLKQAQVIERKDGKRFGQWIVKNKVCKDYKSSF